MDVRTTRKNGFMKRIGLIRQLRVSRAHRIVVDQPQGEEDYSAHHKDVQLQEQDELEPLHFLADFVSFSFASSQ